ncbi:MAG: PDZ domain-containing protein [Myxococcales bacterium]|nr:PDZ domain-containing protein [Myxococcales bacterium]
MSQIPVHLRFRVLKPRWAHDPANMVKGGQKGTIGPGQAEEDAEATRDIQPNRDMFGGHPFDMDLLDALEAYLKGLEANMKECWLNAAISALYALEPSMFAITDKGDPSLYAGDPFKIDKKDKFSLIPTPPLGLDPLKFLARDEGWATTEFTRADFERIMLKWLPEAFPGIDLEALFAKAAQMMVQTGRHGSKLTDPDVLAALNDTLLNRKFAGVGILVSEHHGEFSVSKLAAGGPAEKAKLQINDRLLSVDGEPVQSLGLLQLARRLRGPVGESVEVEYLRGEKASKAKLKREEIAPFELKNIEGLSMHLADDAGLGWIYVIGV